MKLLFSFFGNKYVACSLLLYCTNLFLRPSIGSSSHLVNDKVAHAIIFLSLCISWISFLKKPKLVFWGLVFYGILIEICQYLLPLSFHRGFEVNDFLADAIGVVVGYFICNFFIKKGDLS
jgi:VanZ family protein